MKISRIVSEFFPDKHRGHEHSFTCIDYYYFFYNELLLKKLGNFVSLKYSYNPSKNPKNICAKLYAIWSKNVDLHEYRFRLFDFI